MTTEIADGVWRLSLRGVNAFLVDDGALTLVDAGTPLDAGRIEAAIAETGNEASDVERVLMTHYDLDHAGAFGRIDGLAAPVHAGAADAQVLAGDRSPPLSNHKGFLQRVLGLFVKRPTGPVHGLGDGDTVGSFTAYHTPGHTPGHVAFVSEALGVAFLGDLVSVSDDGEYEPSGWVISYDTDEVRESIRDLAERAPDFDVAGVGHGDPVTEDAGERFREFADALE